MPDSLPPEDEIARLRVEKDQGASPAGSGYSAKPEPVPVSALAGEYPSRNVPSPWSWRGIQRRKAVERLIDKAMPAFDARLRKLFDLDKDSKNVKE